VDRTTGEWKPSHPKFLVPIAALRKVFRAKFRDALSAAAPDLFTQVHPAVWQTTWVVQSQPVGDGRTALKYLAPYIYRVALSNNRLVRLADGTVTFRYKPRTQPWKTMTLDALCFIQRFLQHVLPKGFQKVRSFGFLHPSAKQTFTALQDQLVAAETDAPPSENHDTQEEPSPQDTTVTETPICCPHCGGPLTYIGRLPPHRATRGPPCA
jgi:hypothetical protein